ncbi:MAG: MazG family protein, partial [Planctomycetota bacterium]
GAPRDPASIRRVWEARKKEERARKGEVDSALTGVPAALPALRRAQKLQARAANVGFDWPSIDGVDLKIDEEHRELRDARASGDEQAVYDELGDVLFSVVNLARWLGMDAEAALRSANARFARRFQKVESTANSRGMDLREASLETLESLWQQAKRAIDEGDP